MEDFNLVLKSLISKDISRIDSEALPSSLKKAFDETADRYTQTGNLLDAIKVYAITNNTEKLIKTSLLCIKEEKPYDALIGFLYANQQEHLNAVGFELLKIPDVDAALSAFKAAKNNEMISFIQSNF